MANSAHQVFNTLNGFLIPYRWKYVVDASSIWACRFLDSPLCTTYWLNIDIRYILMNFFRNTTLRTYSSSFSQKASQLNPQQKNGVWCDIFIYYTQISIFTHMKAESKVRFYKWHNWAHLIPGHCTEHCPFKTRWYREIPDFWDLQERRGRLSMSFSASGMTCPVDGYGQLHYSRPRVLFSLIWESRTLMTSSSIHLNTSEC